MKTLPRLAISLLGMCSIALGIVLCKRCNMGISPVSSIPYVLEWILPMSFGTLTMLYHFVHATLQIFILRRMTMGIFIQYVLGVVFGRVIDFFQMLIRFDAQTIPGGFVMLGLSVFLTGFGIVLITSMDLIQDAPDGFVKLVSDKSGKKMGLVKNIYDISCVLISIVLSLVFLGNIKGFGIATVVSAVFVGRVVAVLTPVLLPLLAKLQKR